MGIPCATFFHSRPCIFNPSRKASCSSRDHRPDIEDLHDLFGLSVDFDVDFDICALEVAVVDVFCACFLRVVPFCDEIIDTEELVVVVLVVVDDAFLEFDGHTTFDSDKGKLF